MSESQLRWELADASSPQSTLFDDSIFEREPGRGEFRGLEFLHVRAKSIINDLGGTPYGFRYTINAYRGCSHACSYCFARPTHAYLDLNVGDDFDRKIVVKVNAVERVRAELHPKRWAGEPIAMGTNTDPYQRCEGKYHLTEGIIEALTERSNAFSILTKSTLVLRDIDLLVEASKHADVRVNFSIGTLDDEVWRMTEPGTPHPRQRVKAVKTLNEAGVACGVLMAPIIPGLSDRPEQLEEVVQSCKDAGALSISPVLLHLGGTTKDIFYERVGAERPDLIPMYKRMYGARKYAAKADRDRTTAMVNKMIGKRVSIRPPAPRPAPPAQLNLL